MHQTALQNRILRIAEHATPAHGGNRFVLLPEVAGRSRVVAHRSVENHFRAHRDDVFDAQLRPLLRGNCGDIVGALGRFELARHEFQSVGLDLGVLDLDCCDALLAAGLAREAAQRAIIAVDALRAAGNRFEVPEAELVAAIASLRCGDRKVAMQQSTAAERDFRLPC